MTTAYRELEQRFRRLGAIEQAISVLHWDTAAMMPEGGAGARAEQLATLRVLGMRSRMAQEPLGRRFRRGAPRPRAHSSCRARNRNHQGGAVRNNPL